MTTADKLTYLASTKTLINDAIEAAGLPIPLGTPFRQYPDYLPAVLPITATVDLFGGLPVNAAFSRASTKVSVDPITGNPRTLPAELPDYNLRLIDHADGQDYGFNVLGYEYVTDDGAGGVLPEPYFVRLDSADGGNLADGLSIDLSSYTDAQITSAKIKYQDETGNYLVDNLFSSETLTNGGFKTSVSGWNDYNGSSPTWVAGEMRFDTVGAMGVFQALTTEATDYLFEIDIDLSNYSGNNTSFFLGGSGFINAFKILSDGVNFFYATASAGTRSMYIHSNAGASSTGYVLINSVSVRKLSDKVSFDWSTKILTFNTPLSLAAQNPIIIL